MFCSNWPCLVNIYIYKYTHTCKYLKSGYQYINLEFTGPLILKTIPINNQMLFSNKNTPPVHFLCGFAFGSVYRRSTVCSWQRTSWTIHHLGFHIWQTLHWCSYKSQTNQYKTPKHIITGQFILNVETLTRNS